MSEGVWGFLNVNKPVGITSHDVVAQARRKLRLKKIGHAGTLDPLAEGVLVLCLGAATRLSEYVMHSRKRYRTRLHLGITTDTYDAEGQVTQVREASHIQREVVEQLLGSFQGDIEQIPPMYSAIKQGGRKLYELARSGEQVEREARRVRIDQLTIVDWQPPEFVLDVTCSAGTYIRSLAYDLGEALGVGAYVVGLTRLASGQFTLEQSLALDRLLSTEAWQQAIIPPSVALADWPSVTLDAVAIDHLRHGRAIPASTAAAAGTIFAYSSGGELVAVIQSQDGLWRPDKVFFSA